MKVITVCDHKGGVAKTTTAGALAQGIAYKNKRAKTLLIDADPQGTATRSVYGVKESVKGLYEVMTGKIDINRAIIHTDAGDILPFSPKLRSIDAEFSGLKNKNEIMCECLQKLEGYTHVIIDTSPYLNLANIQALTASDYVVIPIGANPETVESLPETLTTIRKVQANLNERLEIAGAVITLYDGRSNVVRQYAELIGTLCKKNNVKLLKTRIRRGAVINEAHAEKADLFKYSPRSNVAKDYYDAITEMKL